MYVGYSEVDWLFMQHWGYAETVTPQPAPVTSIIFMAPICQIDFAVDSFYMVLEYLLS